MLCPQCSCQPRKFGKTSAGQQRFRCNPCKSTFIDHDAKPLGSMRIDRQRAVLVLKLLLEGMSIRSTQRLTGVCKATICDLLVMAGERAQELMEQRIVDLPVKNVECDETWAFTFCKEKRRQKFYPTETNIGDTFCYVAFDADTKLVLTWHIGSGKRTESDTVAFLEKLRGAASSGYQLSTDAFRFYHQNVSTVLRGECSYGQIIKEYGKVEDEHRYSPAAVKSIQKKSLIGNPDEERICTSYIERNNLNIRMAVRRCSRLSNAYSRKMLNHEAALSLYFAYYNFCWKHGTLEQTPAMEAGLTDHQWTVDELLTS